MDDDQEVADVGVVFEVGAEAGGAPFGEGWGLLGGGLGGGWFAGGGGGVEEGVGVGGVVD